MFFNFSVCLKMLCAQLYHLQFNDQHRAGPQVRAEHNLRGQAPRAAVHSKKALNPPQV